MDGWYVLEASAPHRYRVPWDDELPVAVPTGVPLDEHYFRGFLIYRAWRGQWFLRLRWAVRPPGEADRPAACDDCLLAVGPMNEVVVEVRRTVEGGAAQPGGAPAAAGRADDDEQSRGKGERGEAPRRHRSRPAGTGPVRRCARSGRTASGGPACP
uniref:hypothetical protein n=1 Tax=Nocardia brasiliensis TaxID=37326 RepID=UPI0024550036